MSVVPAEELPVLEALITLRNRLTKLKKDRTEYVKAKDVEEIYQALLQQVQKLNSIRQKDVNNDDLSLRVGESRVDTILNDVFHLLSLFFLTIGRSRERPATYCQLASMKRLLTHLNESGVFTAADLKPYTNRLAELKAIIESDEKKPKTDSDQAIMTQLLLMKWSDCDRLLTKLRGNLNHLSPELAPLHQRLITFRRLLSSIAARPRSTAADVQPIVDELRSIEEKRVDGKFVVDGVAPPKGQELVAGLLEELFEQIEGIQAQQNIDNITRGPLQPIYERLTDIRSQLERLVLTHRWTLRETDLYNYQMALLEIDRMRVDGKFVDSDGHVPDGQMVLLFLLRRCYGLCYRLMISSEPISEELMPIANKLTTIIKCLHEVKKFGGPYSAKDLYPYQMALMQIDDLRVDGKFLGRDGSIPEGQAILNARLSEAHELVAMLREEGVEF